MRKQLFFINRSFLVLSKKDYILHIDPQTDHKKAYDLENYAENGYLNLYINKYILINEDEHYYFLKHKNAKKYYIFANHLKSEFGCFITYFSKFAEDGLCFDGKFIEAIKKDNAILVNLNDVLYFEYAGDSDGEFAFIKEHEKTAESLKNESKK